MRVQSDLAGGPLQSSANINCDRGRSGACLISRLNKSKCYTRGDPRCRTDVSICPVHKILVLPPAENYEDCTIIKVWSDFLYTRISVVFLKLTRYNVCRFRLFNYYGSVLV